MDNKSRVLCEYDTRCTLYRSFALTVKQLLEELIKTESISYNAATCRLKDRDSLDKKIDRKQDKYRSLDELTDIAGVRIITYYSDDIDKVARIVENEFEVDHENSIDKGKSLEPDRFGYCSVHYVVKMSAERLKLREYKAYDGLKCEIQIRTVLQHAWAEIEHDLGYKSEKAIPRDIRRSFSRLAGLLEIGDKEFLEIRGFLSSYTDRIAENIDSNMLDDKELDAVILKELIKTDKNIIEMNSIIRSRTDCTYRVCDSETYYELEISHLHWLGIRTLGELKQMIICNKENALRIAEILLWSDKTKDDSSYIGDTISMFYLCYAELLRNYHDYDSVHQYLNDAHIRFSDDEGFVKQLLDIQKQLNL